MDGPSMLERVNAVLGSESGVRWVLAALKGLRNGLVYGTRIRAPHALVMVFLFGRGPLLQKLSTIATLTRTHAVNLGKFALAYKLGTGALERGLGGRRPWHSALVAAAVGKFVFGKHNGVNMQINLYLLSRVTLGLGRLALAKGLLPPTPPTAPFPLFAAGVWGVVLWLFEWHPDVLQPSLRSSMTYLYHDSDSFSSLWDWLVVNKLPGPTTP